MDPWAHLFDLDGYRSGTEEKQTVPAFPVDSYSDIIQESTTIHS